MTASRARSRIAALLTCGAAVAGFVSLRFARSVLVTTFERSGLQETAFSQLAVFALMITRPGILASVAMVLIAAVATSEIVVRTEAARLLVQVGVLLLLAILLSIALSGLLIPFHIPDVHIP